MQANNQLFREELKKISNSINKKYATLRKELIKTGEVFEIENLPVFPY